MIPAINAFAESWFRYMASASLQAGILAVVLLAIVWIGRRWSPALRHALLMIARIKFAIPPMLSLPTGLFSHVIPIEAPQAPFPADLIVPVFREALWPAEPPPAPPSGISIVPTFPAPAARDPRPSLTVSAWLVLAHLLGSFLVLALIVAQKFRLRRLSREAAPLADPELMEILQSLCAGMKLRRQPRLLLSDKNHSPMPTGRSGPWS